MAATLVSRSTADFVGEYPLMPGKVIVAATDDTFTTAPPCPAGPSGRIARNACLSPRLVPRILTSSISRTSFGSRSTISEEISAPALLISRSNPSS
jgi:hypothetical protein